MLLHACKWESVVQEFGVTGIPAELLAKYEAASGSHSKKFLGWPVVSVRKKFNAIFSGQVSALEGVSLDR